MTRPKDERMLCTATAKQTGEQCGNPRIPGGPVCRFHGGRAPQVQKAAALRLRELVDPAIFALGSIVVDPMTTPTEKLRAIENVLDRAGYPRQHSVDVDAAKGDLAERLEALLAEFPEALDAPSEDA